MTRMTTALAALCVTTLLCALRVDGAHVSIHASLGAQQAAPTTATSTASAILYTRVVEDFQGCGSSNAVLAMCASKDFVCRMKDNQAMFAMEPQCLPNDPDVQGANTLEDSATKPWQQCDPNHDDVNVPTCRLSFQCMCAQTQKQIKSRCRCVPPDSVPGRSLLGESCGKSKTSSGACTSGEYCKWTQEGEQVCGKKPYFS